MGTLVERLRVEAAAAKEGDGYPFPQDVRDLCRGLSALLHEAADLIAAQQRTIELQANEIRSLEADARRYRWLRDTPYIGVMRTGNIRNRTWGWSIRARTGTWIDDESLDAAIDAALSAQRGGG